MRLKSHLVLTFIPDLPFSCLLQDVALRMVHWPIYWGGIFTGGRTAVKKPSCAKDPQRCHCLSLSRAPVSNSFRGLLNNRGHSIDLQNLLDNLYIWCHFYRCLFVLAESGQIKLDKAEKYFFITALEHKYAAHS